MDHGAAPPGNATAHVHRPDGGSFVGHLLPGAFFLIWSTYWLVSVIAEYLHKQRAKQEFRSRGWYPFGWNPRAVEPWCKVALSLLGALVELRLGHDSWRPIYKKDHHFEANFANNFQHALMYAGVALSGAVDLLGMRFKLPAETEKVYLSLAFLVEALLMGLHSKHHDLDKMVHQLLTAVMVASSVACLLEAAWPKSILLALLRPYTVFLQGTWFIQVGYMLFLGIPAWDLGDMGPLMFAPVVFCLHLVLVGSGFLATHLVMQHLFEEWYGPGAARKDLVLGSLDELELAEAGPLTESTKLLGGGKARKEDKD